MNLLGNKLGNKTKIIKGIGIGLGIVLFLYFTVMVIFSLVIYFRLVPLHVY
jgi:hypothetical protein